MPFDAGGTFTRSYNWQADRDAGIKILAQRMDGEFNNYAGGLNQTFLRTGIVPMGGPLNMNSNPIVGVAGGTLISPGIRFESDTDTGFMQSGPGNLTMVVDGVAMMTATAAGVNIGGTVPIIAGSGIAVNSGIVRVPDGSAAAPSYTFNSNQATGMWRNTSDGNIGISIGGTGNIVTIAANGVGVAGGITVSAASQITGGLTVYGGDIAIPAGSITALAHYVDPTYWMAMQSSLPILNFDSNDYMRYDRAGNVLTTFVGGGAVLELSPGTVNAIAGLLYVGDANHYLQQYSGTALHRFDAGDSMLFDRAGNQFVFYIADTVRLAIAPNLATINTHLSVSNNINSVSGIIGTAAASAGNVKLNAGGGANAGYIEFTRPDAVRHGYIGFAASPTGSISYQNDQGGGHNFGGGGISAGDIVLSGVLKAATVYPGNDNNYYGIMISGNPYINFDAGDFIVYDRALNQWNFNIAGSYPLVISPSGTYVSGIEAGYRDIPIRVVNTPGGNVGAGDRGRAVQFVPGASNYGLPDLQTGSVVTLINSSGIVQTIVEAGVQLYWAVTNSRGNVNLSPGALATVLWTGGNGCVIAGTGVYR